jgi:hypothetical protein
MTASRNSIILEAEDYIYEENVANGAITPGFLLEFSSGKVQAHSAAGQNAMKMFAIEDSLQGNTVDDDYAADDQVRCGIFKTGHKVLGILKDGENVAEGDPLESAGDGTLQKHTPDVHTDSSGALTSQTIYSNNIVGFAAEALNLEGSSATESYDSDGTGWNKRIALRIA